MKKDIHHIHDKTYRSFFENKEIFLELLQSFINETWTTKLEKESLIEDKSHYILRDFEEAEADIVYKATIENQEVIFCILLELQSTVDYSMPIRLFYYITEIWRKYIKEHSAQVKRQSFKLPAVVPIVLYNGDHTWTAPVSFKDKVQRANLFGEHVIDFKYILINVNGYTKEDLVAIQNTVSAIFLLDQKVDSAEFVERAAIVATQFRKLSDEHKLKLKDWLDHIIESPIREVVLDLLEKNGEDVTKMTANITITLMEEKAQAIAEGKAQGIAEGRAEGKAQGIAEGRAEGRAEGEHLAHIAIAKKLLAKGMSIEEIMDITDLDQETLETLK